MKVHIAIGTGDLSITRTLVGEPTDLYRQMQTLLSQILGMAQALENLEAEEVPR